MMFSKKSEIWPKNYKDSAKL